MAPSSVIKPSALAHVVFRTANFRGMVDFYAAFLGAEVTFENEHLAFLRYDEEHHRIAILCVPDAGPKNAAAVGLEHVAFTFKSLKDLLTAHQQRKELDMRPFWCVNHGPTTSIYYRDPDGNSLETQVDNFDTPEEANAFMTSNYFAENPIGVDFDPQELMERLQAGESEDSAKKRKEIGPRDTASLMKALAAAG